MTDTNNQNDGGQKAVASSKTGLILGLSLVVVIGGFTGWSLMKSEPEPVEPIPVKIVEQQVEPEPEPEPPALELEVEPEPPIPEPLAPQPEPEPEPQEPEVVLPQLEQSDGVVFEELTNMSWHHDFAALFVNKDIIRRFVVFVDNAASGNVEREYASFKPPISRFKVKELGEKTFIDDSSFERYDAYIAVLSSAQPEDMVILYNKYKPLIKAVYDEIGYPDIDFTDTLVNAIDQVLETPIIESQIEVVSPKVMYNYQDEALQSLSHVQRQALRLGGANLKKLKPILRKYRSLLAME